MVGTVVGSSSRREQQGLAYASQMKLKRQYSFAEFSGPEADPIMHVVRQRNTGTIVAGKRRSAGEAGVIFLLYQY